MSPRLFRVLRAEIAELIDEGPKLLRAAEIEVGIDDMISIFQGTVAAARKNDKAKGLWGTIDALEDLWDRMFGPPADETAIELRWDFVEGGFTLVAEYGRELPQIGWRH
jgi:hypothetical protein